MLQVSIVDYGVGNLHSISKALARAGARPVVVRSPGRIVGARALVFPGVGAFGAAARGLRAVRSTLAARLRDGLPALGVCLGMQMFCDASDEGAGLGLGLLPGRVRRLRASRLPNIGWTKVRLNASGAADPLLDSIGDGSYFYFVHSYRLPSGLGRGGRVLATAEHGESFPALVRTANCHGTQFHPEKSSDAGSRLVENWVRFAESES